MRTLNEIESVWVFHGEGSDFSSAIFTQQNLAEAWIKESRVSGILTQYPLNISVYDWCIKKGFFEPEHDDQRQPEFIQKFSSSSQSHRHFENGESHR